MSCLSFRNNQLTPKSTAALLKSLAKVRELNLISCGVSEKGIKKFKKAEEKLNKKVRHRKTQLADISSTS